MVQKLPQSNLDDINLKLMDNYGRTENYPNFRLVWADDEREQRLTNYTPEGLQLLTPVVREMRKYPDIRERYVLERLIENFEFSKLEDGKPVSKLVYQAIWMFEILDENRQKAYIAPNYGACRFVVETLLGAIANPGVYTKYKDPEARPDDARELREMRIKSLEEDLFGNESAIADSLGLRQGIAYGPGSSPNSSNPSIKGIE